MTKYDFHLLVNISKDRYDIENNTWVRGNTRFISSVEHDMYHEKYVQHEK